MDLTGGAADIAPRPMRIVGKRKVGGGSDAFEYFVLPHRHWLHQDFAELDQDSRREWDRRKEQGMAAATEEEREENLPSQCIEENSALSSDSDAEDSEDSAAAYARRWLKAQRSAKRRTTMMKRSLSGLKLNDLEHELLRYILLDCTDHTDLICHVARCAAVCRQWRSILIAKDSPTSRLLWAPVPRELKLLDFGRSFTSKKLEAIRKMRLALRRARLEGKLSISFWDLSMGLATRAGIALCAAMQAMLRQQRLRPAQVRVEDVLQHLERVKLAVKWFGLSPMMYSKFLRVIRDFKGHTVDTACVSQHVWTMFGAQINTFLPQGYKLTGANLAGGAYLSQIDLGDCVLTPTAMPSFAALLVTPCRDSSMLTTLRLRRNPRLGDDGLSILAGALPVTLTELTLEDTGCSCVGVQAVAKRLPLLTRLAKFSLASNSGIKRIGWETLGHTLTQMPSLTELCLSGCIAMKCAGAGAVVAALPTCASPPPLTLVDLRRCGIGDAGAQVLVSDLLSSTSLKTVVLSGNRISKNMKAALKAAAATMRIELIACS
eukprot:COSAG02_NODE_452_length_22047_cov_20.154502_1_plen_547_part_00